MTKSSVGIRIVSFIGLILVWQIASELVNQPRIFPAPVVVASMFWHEARYGTLGHDLLATMIRVVASFISAIFIGTALGLAMGRYKVVDAMFDGWLILFLNMPALVVIVLAYIWFGLTEAAAISAVAVNKIPSVTATIREGTKTLDRDLSEMAAVYRLGRWRTFRHVILPQLVPYLLVSTRTGLALIWKIVLVVEMLGRSDGIGFQISTYFQLFDVPRILAYSLAFIVVVQALELGVIVPVERRCMRWRR